MRSSSRRNRCTLLLVLVGLLIARPSGSDACGPFLDFGTIINSSSEAFLHMPRGVFEHELAKIPLPKTPFKYVEPTTSARFGNNANIAADIADLRAALKLNTSMAESHPATDCIIQTRAALEQYHDAVLSAARSKAGNAPPKPALQLSDALPTEFRHYLAGYAAMKSFDLPEARRCFQKVLDLPADQRTYRTVWAAFMIGRSFQQDDPKQAIAWFIKTRDLAAAGNHDTLGLAAASYGWQARACLDQADLASAIDLYLLQRATGDPSAVASLQITGLAALKAKPPTLAELAKHSNARAVITAVVVSLGGPWRDTPAKADVGRWLTALEAADIKSLPGAERQAWSAYQYGHYDLAQRWADRAGDDPIAQWVQAKLLLRDGKVDPALKLLAAASKAFPVNTPVAGEDDTLDSDDYVAPFRDHRGAAKRMAGEIGAIRLGRAEFAEALDLLHTAGYWEDAALIAERVLTADELKAYVDRATPTTRPAQGVDPEALRSLLARRLLRLGRWKDARPYFSAERQKTLDAYIQHIREGHDANRAEVERGNSLYAAAVIARQHGMELMGTTLAPDGGIVGGSFDWHDAATYRGKQTFALLKPSADELKRLARPAEQLNRRFHYRYTAADHAWKAAQLLPDNDPLTAEVLNTAGGWLKARDPMAADRFYQALVTRCGQTPLGQEAKRRKWFVPEKSKEK